MTQAQHTHPGTSNVLPAAAAALVMAAALAIAALVSGQVTIPTIQNEASGVSTAVMQTGQDWEAQRQQQAGTGAVSGVVLRSGQDWEGQRRAQGGDTADRAFPTDPKIR